MPKLPVEQIDADFAVMVRDGTDWDTVQRYAEVLEQMPPITVFKVDGRYLLADGFHRYSAALQRDWKEIEAEVLEGARETALEHAIVANLGHGRPLTASEYKKAAQRLGWLYGVRVEVQHAGISYEPAGIVERIAKALNRGPFFVDTVLRADAVRQHIPATLTLSDRALQEISRAPQSAWRTLAEAALAQGWTVENVKDRVRLIKAGEPVTEVVAGNGVPTKASFFSERLRDIAHDRDAHGFGGPPRAPILREELRQAIREDPELRMELLIEARSEREEMPAPSIEPASITTLESQIETEGYDGNGAVDGDVVNELVKGFDQQIRNILAQVPDRASRVADIVQEELTGLERRLNAYPKNTQKMDAKFEQLRIFEERGVIPYTIWDFQYRDDYAGDKGFHGNCSPQIVEQCVWRLTNEGDLVVDPMVGSGTTIDVCKEHNRRCLGYDLTPVRDDIIQADAKELPLDDDSADMVFIHPPYWSMVRYSNGNRNPADLSRAATIEDFTGMLKAVLQECKRVLKPGKYLCVLLGDMVKKGAFVPICRKAANLLEEIGMVDSGYAVKLAHGDTSRRKSGVIVAELVATDNLKVSHDLAMFFRK